MALTTSQLTVLRTDILADPALNVIPNTPDGNLQIAGVYNTVFVPDFWVYRSAVSKADYVQGIGPEGTTFTWVGNGFISRSAGEQAAWREIFSVDGYCNPSLANVRQAFTDIFSGTGNAAANRTHLAAVSRRLATRGERLFAVGTGTTASPATMVVEGNISGDDVQAARNLP